MIVPNAMSKPDSDENTMTLTGKGQVSVDPDIAILRLGVQTTGDSLTFAQEENANISQAVIEALRELGITEMKTFQYEVSPIFDYEDGQRIDRGYSVRNILEIRTTDLEQVGQLIDTAVYQGANVVDLINFEVADSDQAYLKALNLAILDAFEKAESITNTLGTPYHPIPRHITENSTGAIPYRNVALGERAFATPIESGSKQIEASVTVEFIY